jgi:pyruvate dehydrogenase (quinone)
VTWEQRGTEGAPKFPGSQDVPDFRYADYARLIGFEGLDIARPEDVAPVWERALAATRPVVIDARVDPDVPPYPANVTFKQARNYVSALLKGDPDAWGVVKQSAKEAVP